MMGLRSRPDAERLQSIAQIVADECGVPLQVLRGRDRHDYIAVPRMLAYALQREATNARCDAIAKWWSRCRGTVEHGIRATQNRAETTPSFRLFIATLRTKAGIK